MENNKELPSKADRHVSYHEDMQEEQSPNMQMGMQMSSSACKIACSCACMQVNVQLHDIFLCKEGLSIRHINILSIIKQSFTPMSYKQIADILTTYFDLPSSPDSVRGILQRMKAKKLISAKFTRHGFARGNVYSCSSKICPHIPPFTVQAESKNPVHFAPSIDRIDRNLSTYSKSLILSDSANSESTPSARNKLEALSDEDITFFWGNLARSGFGKIQIGQIIQRLEQQGLSLDQVMQGLTHAEWDLEHNQMKDKSGELVKSPTNWVFQILARQGYYPRPHNFTSAKEQAELDTKQERERLEKLQEENDSKTFEEWLARLTEEEKSKFADEQKEKSNSTYTFPEGFLLRSYFREMQKQKVSFHSS